MRARSPWIFFLAGAAALFSQHGAAQTGDTTGWQFSVTPYVWLAGFEGQTRVSGLGGNIDTESGSILESLDFAAMLNVEARRAEWSLFADFIYVDLGTDKTSPGPLASSASIDLRGTVVSAGVSRTVVRKESFALEALGGLRYIEVRDEIGLQIGGATRSFSETRDWVDPIVGVRGHLDLSSRWFVPYYLDVGGFGVSSDLTWQGVGGVGYRFGWGDVRLTYRYLSYDFKDGSFVYDIDVGGPMIGARVQF
jgi:hypothetical protein